MWTGECGRSSRGHCNLQIAPALGRVFKSKVPLGCFVPRPLFLVFFVPVQTGFLWSPQLSQNTPVPGTRSSASFPCLVVSPVCFLSAALVQCTFFFLWLSVAEWEISAADFSSGAMTLDWGQCSVLLSDWASQLHHWVNPFSALFLFPPLASHNLQRTLPFHTYLHFWPSPEMLCDACNRVSNIQCWSASPWDPLRVGALGLWHPFYSFFQLPGKILHYDMSQTASIVYVLSLSVCIPLNGPSALSGFFLVVPEKLLVGVPNLTTYFNKTYIAKLYNYTYNDSTYNLTGY